MTTYGELRTPAEVETDRRILARVKKGIALLEEKYGADWVDKIDLHTLRLQSSASCVLGQVGGYHDYHHIARHLFGPAYTGPSAEHGFVQTDTYRYDDLNRVWQQEIKALKEARN